MDPITFMAVAGVASAALEKKGADAAIMAEADANQKNANAQALEITNQQSDAAAAAGEKITDRMRQAARDISMARVASSEGGGSLAARLSNIEAGSAEDTSRLEANLSRQNSTLASQRAAVDTQARGVQKTLQTKAKNAQLSFFANLASTAASAYATNAVMESNKAAAAAKVVK